MNQALVVFFKFTFICHLISVQQFSFTSLVACVLSFRDLNLCTHEKKIAPKLRADSKNTSDTQQCNYHHIESFDEALL